MFSDLLKDASIYIRNEPGIEPQRPQLMAMPIKQKGAFFPKSLNTLRSAFSTTLPRCFHVLWVALPFPLCSALWVLTGTLDLVLLLSPVSNWVCPSSYTCSLEHGGSRGRCPVSEACQHTVHLTLWMQTFPNTASERYSELSVSQTSTRFTAAHQSYCWQWWVYKLLLGPTTITRHEEVEV